MLPQKLTQNFEYIKWLWILGVVTVNFFLTCTNGSMGNKTFQYFLSLLLCFQTGKRDVITYWSNPIWILFIKIFMNFISITLSYYSL